MQFPTNSRFVGFVRLSTQAIIPSGGTDAIIKSNVVGTNHRWVMVCPGFYDRRYVTGPGGR